MKWNEEKLQNNEIGKLKERNDDAYKFNKFI